MYYSCKILLNDVEFLIMSITDKTAPDAIILHANYAVFSPGQIITHPGKVQSRMLLWCKSGKGILTVDGETFQFSAGRFIFMPWNHLIRYKADEKDPFLVAGIHIVPELKRRGNVSYGIFHQEMPDIAEYRRRKDVRLPGFDNVVSGSFLTHNALESLAEYIVAWFQHDPHEEFMARNLAHALLYELSKTQEIVENKAPELQRILDFIERKIADEISIDDLSKIANASRSSIFRLFKKHLECSPVNWILKRKVERAKELLCKTSLRIGEIGAELSIDDPYYFSKVFKKFSGVTAREFRSGKSLFNKLHI